MAGYIGSKAVSVNTTSATISDDLAVGDDLAVTDDATIGGLLTVTGGTLLNGTTPTLTIGDAGAEDAKIVFDGNAADYHIGLDDSEDALQIGLGSALGTTPRITIRAAEVVANDLGIDLDFRVESDDNANMLFVDGGLNKVGIGVVPVQGVLTIKSGGNTYATSNLVLEDTDSTSRSYITHVNGDLAITNNTSRDDLILDSSANFKIVAGNLVIGTAGKGIDFSATSDGAGTDSSELLDDYEEGTWTPTWASVTNPSYTVQVGHYTKVGRLVTFHMAFQWNGGTSIGPNINGLPYTVKNSAENYYMSSAYNDAGVTYGTGRTTLVAYPVLNQTYLQLNANGSAVNGIAPTFATSGALYATGFYYT